MKKIFLYIIWIIFLSSLYQGVFALPTQIGTLPSQPQFKIRVSDEDVAYVVKNASNFLYYYDKSWNVVSSIDTSNSYGVQMGRFMIETENAIYLYYQLFSEPRYKNLIIKYNKTTWNFSDIYKYAWGHLNWPCLDDWYLINICSYPNIKIVMDEKKLVFALNTSETKYYIDIDDTSDTITMNSYTGSIQNSSMELVTFSSSYRASLNNLNYLKEADKTYNWILKDTQGDIVRVFDWFVTTYNISNYSYLYNYQTNSTVLSFMWSDNEDMRSYYDYEIWSANYIDDTYYTSEVNWWIVQIQPSSVMWYDYSVGTFAPNIDLYYIGWEYIFYWVTSTWAVYKDSDIVLEDYLFNFPWGGSVDPTWDIFNIFDFDQNDDGSISFEEALTWFFSIPWKIFDFIADYIQNLVDLILWFTNYEPPEFEHLFTSTWGYSWISGALMQKLDQTPDAGNWTIFSKVRVMFQYGLYFLIATLFLAVFVAFKRRNN